MGYLGELRANWRPLLAVMIGLCSGMSMIGTITNIMAPHFIKEFGWTNQEFAYVNSLSFLTIVTFPIIGRMADTLGVRKTAAIGVTLLPLTFIVISMMTGDIRVYMVLFLVQALLCITTTVSVYSRVVVQYIQHARGLALGIVGASPYLVSLAVGPLLNWFVIAYGWRAGYQALAVTILTTGIIALLMAPPHGRTPPAAASVPEFAPGAAKRRARDDYPMIMRQPAFWLLVATMVLINLPQTIVIAQFGLAMLENGITSGQIGVMVSALSAGTLAGRLLCGIALDHWPAHWVAFISMLLPAIGLFLLASDMNTFNIVLIAVLFIGLAFGAEGDIVGFLVVRIFGVGVYSSVMGLMTAAISVTTSAGAALAGATLAATGNYNLFLTITSITVTIGALLFLLLPLVHRKAPEPTLASAE